MGICRTWNGNAANYIQVPISNWTGGISAFSAAGWVKITGALPGDYAFCGRFEPESGSVTDGFRFALRDFDSGTTNKLELNIIKAGASTGYGQQITIAQNVWTFVAVTYSDPVDGCRFYVGTTPNNIAQVGSSQAAAGLVGNIGDVRLGQVHHEQSSGAFKYPMNGLMDHWGLWNTAHTLNALQAFANRCNVAVFQGNANFILTITGDSPEPNASTAFPGNGGVITGSLPVVVESTGCDIAGGVFAPGNPPIPPSPRISGGIGGGLNVPTLDYNDGAGDKGIMLDPIKNNAREVQAPDFGDTKGKIRRKQTGSRIAPMFRGLNDLAARIGRHGG